MNIMAIFDQDPFRATDLTATVSNMPYKETLLSRLINWDSKGVFTTDVAVQENNGRLNLVPFTPRGGVPTPHRTSKRGLRKLPTQSIALTDTITASELLGLVGSIETGALERVQNVISDRMGEMAESIDYSMEAMRLGCVRGQIVDPADGSVVLDLYSEFNVAAPATVTFDFSAPALGLREKLQDVRRSMARALGAASSDNFKVAALVSGDVMNQLTGNSELKESFDRWQDGAWQRSGFAFGSFEFANTLFLEYRGSDAGDFGLADDEIRFVPYGVPGLWLERFAPADSLASIGIAGTPRSASIGRDPSGRERFVTLDVESHPLLVMTKPQALIPGQAL